MATNDPHAMEHGTGIRWTAAAARQFRRARDWTRRDAEGLVLPRRLFLSLLGVVYLIAFASLAVQVRGLIGSRGILPADEYLTAVHAQLGAKAYWQLPTLLWIDAGDAMLVGLCWAGIALSLALIAGIAPAVCLTALLVLYASLMNGDVMFLSYQWDALLLETGFLAIFLAPWHWRPRAAREAPPPWIAVWLLRWLLVRLMFMSGAVKLASGDELWRNLTAVAIHYESQPLPTWIGWFAFQLPLGFQKFSCLVMFFIELAVPFFVFGPRRVRLAACGLTIALQILIALTGNYTFFNLLTIALCLLLIDDAFLRRWMPQRRIEKTTRAENAPRLPCLTQRIVIIIVALFVFPSSVAKIAEAWRRPAPRIPLIRPVQNALYAHRLVSWYGLFSNMTEGRREIAIEGSDDGVEWKPWPWRWKPDDVKRRSLFVAPHQPRLDWQMWFASLGHRNSRAVVQRLMLRLLEGSDPVERLLGPSPFPDAPPRYIRATIYQYHMTDWKTRREEGAWWRREPLGLFIPPMTLPQK
jgi:hypothetical protein